MSVCEQTRVERRIKTYSQILDASPAMSDLHKIDPKDLISESAFKPPHDNIFNALFGLAMEGKIGVYFGAVPLRLIRPFSDDFKFAMIPNGPQIIASIIDEATRGIFAHLWVYEQGDYFVMSDDYPYYEACVQGQPDCVPCWILGRPENPLVEQVQGPVDARQAAGFSS